MKYIFSNRQGFTIIEILIYLSIATILLFSLTSFIFSVTNTRKRLAIINEVEWQGAQITNQIIQTISGADSITSPAVGNSAVSLSLTTYNIGQNPTIFSLAGGYLQKTAGASSTINLHNNLVQASDLIFTNVSRDNTAGIINFSFKLKYVNSDGRIVNNYEKIFQSAVSLR